MDRKLNGIPQANKLPPQIHEEELGLQLSLFKRIRRNQFLKGFELLDISSRPKQHRCDTLSILLGRLDEELTSLEVRHQVLSQPLVAQQILKIVQFLLPKFTPNRATESFEQFFLRFLIFLNEAARPQESKQRLAQVLLLKGALQLLQLMWPNGFAERFFVEQINLLLGCLLNPLACRQEVLKRLGGSHIPQGFGKLAPGDSTGSERLVKPHPPLLLHQPGIYRWGRFPQLLSEP